MLNWIDATTSLTATANGNLYTLRYDSGQWTGTVTPQGQLHPTRRFGPCGNVEKIKSEISAYAALSALQSDGEGQ